MTEFRRVLFRSLALRHQIKSLEAELAPPHAQSAWGSRDERVQAARFAAYSNYLLKKNLLLDFN